MIAPVGLFGNEMIIAFVLSVTAASNCSFLSLNLSSSLRLTITGVPPAITTHAT